MATKEGIEAKPKKGSVVVPVLAGEPLRVSGTLVGPFVIFKHGRFYNLTHAPTGLRFAWIKRLGDAKKLASRLAMVSGVDTNNPDTLQGRLKMAGAPEWIVRARESLTRNQQNNLPLLQDLFPAAYGKVIPGRLDREHEDALIQEIRQDRERAKKKTSKRKSAQRKRIAKAAKKSAKKGCKPATPKRCAKVLGKRGGKASARAAKKRQRTRKKRETLSMDEQLKLARKALE